MPSDDDKSDDNVIFDSKPLFRQHSEPTPDSVELPEKKNSWKRQVTEPGRLGSKERLPFLRRQKQLIHNKLKNAESAVDLAKALRLDALAAHQKPPWLLISLIVFFNVLGKIGDAIGPAIVSSRPVQLLLINASNTHCILTTTTVSFVPWLIIAVGRRFCEDPLYFYAGWAYRESCLGMLRKWSPDMADGFHKAEDLFRSNLYVAVAVNPGATVCSLAGASRMQPALFIILNVGSTAAQLILMRYICLQYPGYIDDALGLIKQYMMYLLAIMVGITIFGALPMLRGKKKED